MPDSTPSTVDYPYAVGRVAYRKRPARAELVTVEPVAV